VSQKINFLHAELTLCWVNDESVLLQSGKQGAQVGDMLVPGVTGYQYVVEIDKYTV